MKLNVRHIKKSFGEHNVLQDVSFSVSEGEVSVLMGTNGSGKTTLFNIVSGFIRQDTGDVF
jgi:branched-chain amino acid transport system ATP-binding protein